MPVSTAKFDLSGKLLSSRKLMMKNLHQTDKYDVFELYITSVVLSCLQDSHKIYQDIVQYLLKEDGVVQDEL